MILLPKYRDIIVPCSGHVGVGGFYRLEAIGHYGSRWLTPWFHNHITNVGLDMMASNTGRYAACQIGTGNTAPTDVDTTLQVFHAGTTTKVNVSSSGNTSTTPYYYEHYMRYDFATGAVNGNMAEVGIGPSASSGANLYSRELIRDSGGSPTTISIAVTEALRVHHRLRHYAPVADVTGTVNGTIAGSPASRNFTRRALNAGRSPAWAPRDSDGDSGTMHGTSASGNNGPIEYHTGSLVAANSASDPTGALFAGTTVFTPASYSSGSYSRTGVHVLSGSETGNVKTVTFYAMSPSASISNKCARFQVEFDTTINKGSLDKLTFETQISWGRYP